VLFMDVVAYSRLPMDRQLLAGRRLTEIVQNLPEFKKARAAGHLVSLWTGDGMALTFFGEFTDAVHCARQVVLGLKPEDGFTLRMGIHTGPVYRMADINANLNIAGGGINVAQRVMDCGDAGHILISKTTADMLAQLSGWKLALHDLGEAVVKHGDRVHIFNLYGDGIGNPARPSKMSQAPPAEPNLGRLVSKLCDRQAQEEEFRERFRRALLENPGSPQVFFIPGEEGQCHESLVERLVHRAEELTVTESSTGREKAIPWQHEGELAQRTSRLLYSLFENLGPSARKPASTTDLSPAAFSRLIEASLNAYIVLKHDLRTGRWDAITEALLANYLQFWSDLPHSEVRPPVLIFISVILPRGEKSGWKKLLPDALDPTTTHRNSIHRTLKSLEKRAAVPCRVLAELPPVTRDDVLDWFRDHSIYESEAHRIRAVDRLFSNGVMRPKAMMEIERFCQEELRNFAAERGAYEHWQGGDGGNPTALFGRGDSGFATKPAAPAI
jgi:class 3 adenylate cyclase